MYPKKFQKKKENLFYRIRPMSVTFLSNFKFNIATGHKINY